MKSTDVIAATTFFWIFEADVAALAHQFPNIWIFYLLFWIEKKLMKFEVTYLGNERKKEKQKLIIEYNLIELNMNSILKLKYKNWSVIFDIEQALEQAKLMLILLMADDCACNHSIQMEEH